MGDNLAQLLYAAFCNASNLVPGSGDVPNWASMPRAQREVWEQVATKARGHVTDQVFASLDSYQSEHDDGAEDLAHVVIREFRAAWGRER